MRSFILALLVLFSFVTLASAQPLEISQLGFLGYYNLGQTVNLTKFNAVAQYQNSSGLFPANTSVAYYTPQINFTDGEVWFVGGDDSNGNNCNPLPMLKEDSVPGGEHFGTPSCPTRFGYIGNNFQHMYLTAANGVLGCVGSCPVFRVRIRVRADGWILAFAASLTPVPVNNRAAVLRWRSGGTSNVVASVDDTMLGVAISRTLSVLNQTAGVLTTPVTYAPASVQYYDYNHTNATTILIFGSGRPVNTYLPNTYGFGFSIGAQTILHASASTHARFSGNPGNDIVINGRRWMCVRSHNHGAIDTTVADTSLWRIDFNSTGGLTDCTAGGAFIGFRGQPFFSSFLNTTAFNIVPGVFNNVTANNEELKLAIMFYMR